MERLSGQKGGPMICEVCGHTNTHADRVDRTFTVEQKLILVEGIPAELCNDCGSASFSAEVAERLRRLVHEPHRPARLIQAEVLEYHAAS